MLIARGAAASLALLAACARTVERAPAKPDLVVAGSTSMMPVVDELVGALRRTRRLRIAVEGGGSAHGIVAVGTGAADVGMTSREPKYYEQRAFPGLVYHRVAVDGISIVVHASNQARGLTKAALRAIYLGQVTDWRELGGEGAILPLVATIDHGTFDGFADFLELDGERSADGATVELRPRKAEGRGFAVTAIDGSAAMLGAVLANCNAIACVSTGATNAMRARGSALVALPLDGADATDANLLTGKYPFQRSLWLVTRGTPTGAAELLVGHALGADGQRALPSLNVVPAATARAR
jgi:phosphate transport system substrate-binding protein